MSDELPPIEPINHASPNARPSGLPTVAVVLSGLSAVGAILRFILINYGLRDPSPTDEWHGAMVAIAAAGPMLCIIGPLSLAGLICGIVGLGTGTRGRVRSAVAILLSTLCWFVSLQAFTPG